MTDTDLHRARKATAAIIILDDGYCNMHKITCANCPIKLDCIKFEYNECQKKNKLFDWLEKQE